MGQLRVGRRRTGPASWRQTPLPLEARDPDIVHAHQITRRTSGARAGRARPPHGSARAAGRQQAKEDTMHPEILRQFSAERVREMIADADDARRARQARRARRSRTPAPMTRPGQASMHAELQPASPNTAIAALPAAYRSGPSADGDQGQPDELAFHLPAARR